MDFDTTRPTWKTDPRKCHVSHVVCDTDTWEQKLAQTLDGRIATASGASKWNPIEHRLFSEVSRNWAADMLTETLTGVAAAARMNAMDAASKNAKELRETVFKASHADPQAWPIVFTKVPECVVGPGVAVRLPGAAFYLWAGVPGGDDVEFARGLLAQYNVAVLPGSLLARASGGANPGAGRIRMALVADVDECVTAARRIVSYTEGLRAASALST